MKQLININGIARETEKAVLVNAIITFNHEKYSNREIWMPKSLVGRNVENEMLEVEDWFLAKLSEQNAFKGYQMLFDRPVTC